MTQREHRLRQRIDQLTRQRDRYAATLEGRDAAADTRRQRPPTPANRELHHGCIYCGHGPAKGSPQTCHGHRDLLALDPHYSQSAPPANKRSERPAKHPQLLKSRREPQPLRPVDQQGNVAA